MIQLVPWRNQHLGRPFTHQLSDAFDHLFRGDLALLNEELSVFAPKVNVRDSEKEIHISAELPGMDEKNIQLDLSNDGLTITGEKKLEEEETGKNFYRLERSYGNFNRFIPLPENLQREKATASYKKGVLNVVIPKQPQATPTKLEIKSE